MAKEGIDYFPLNCQLDEKFELIEAEFGLKGFAIVVKLLQRIYGEHGYYCEYNNDISLLLARQCGLSFDGGNNLINQIVSASIKRGIFNEEKFKAFGILTSKGIQKRFLDAARQRKEVFIENDYLLLSDAEIKGNTVIIGKNPVGNDENSGIFEQRRGKERKGKDSIDKPFGASCYFDNPALNEAFCFFLTYRQNNFRERVAPETVTLMAQELERIAPTDEERIAVLNTAVFKGWKNFYPPDKKGKGKKSNNFNACKSRDYDMPDLEKQLLERRNP